ncbi:hypothetical protein, partial [Salmonella enterica]
HASEKSGLITRRLILSISCLNNQQYDFCQLHFTNATEPDLAYRKKEWRQSYQLFSLRLYA